MSTSKPFLGLPTTFKKAYPNIKTIKLHATHRGEVTSEMQRLQYYSEASLPREIPCPNPRCRQGGYSLTGLVISLDHDRLPEYETRYSCNGHEGSPAGRREGSPCMNSVAIKVQATYSE